MSPLLISLAVAIAAFGVAAAVLVRVVADVRRSLAASRESFSRIQNAWQPVVDEKKAIAASLSKLSAALAERERAAAALAEISRAKENVSDVMRFARTALQLKRSISGGGVSALAITLAETLLRKGGSTNE